MSLVTTAVSDADLLQAIQLRISKCFGAMNIANALGGSPTTAWKIAREYRLAVLVEEALDRLLPLSDLKAAVDETPFMETESYLKLRDEIGGKAGFPK